jgi:hypothetical protein
MVLFVTPPEQEIQYVRGEIINNWPVNLELCTELVKIRVRWYPDNRGLPGIKFNGCDSEWAFTSEEERDQVFNSLASNTYEGP